MEEERRLVTNCGFLIIILSVVYINGVRSESYTVGGEVDKWDSGVNYFTWSEKYNFTVGDVLVFKYTKGNHNTYEVTEATFKTCNTSTGVLATYESGNDQVTLTEAKKYWFICEIKGHCLGGQRFTIDVNNTPAAPPPAGDVNNTTPAAPPVVDSSDSHAYNKPRMAMYFIVFFILLKLFF